MLSTTAKIILTYLQGKKEPVTSDQIASDLFMAPDAVKTHVSSLRDHQVIEKFRAGIVTVELYDILKTRAAEGKDITMQDGLTKRTHTPPESMLGKIVD